MIFVGIILKQEITQTSCYTTVQAIHLAYAANNALAKITIKSVCIILTHLLMPPLLMLGRQSAVVARAGRVAVHWDLHAVERYVVFNLYHTTRFFRPLRNNNTLRYY